jgi:hypothetical protein
MAILWKPTGALDINTEPTDLPEQSGDGGIISGAMTRCKNLSFDRHGKATLRAGSTVLTTFALSAAPELLLEVGGHRYTFAGDDIYYDEAITTETVTCAEAVFTPDGGSYTTQQTVTITTDTAAANIHYTTNNSTPDDQSPIYASTVLVPINSYLKAIVIDPRGILSDSGVVTAFYSLFAQDALITETNEDTLITETNSDTLTSEGP